MIGIKEKGKIVLAIKNKNGRLIEILPEESENFIDYIFWDKNTDEAVVEFEKLIVKNRNKSELFAKIIPPDYFK